MRLPRARALLLTLCLGLAAVADGCSWMFDDSVIDVPLSGDPIPPTAFPRLNVDGAPVNDLYIVQGVGGSYWAVMVEAQAQLLPPLSMTPPRSTARLSRLDAPADDEILQADQILIDSQLLYLLDVAADDTSPTKLRLHQPGDGGGRQLSMPAGNAIIIPNADDSVFVYIVSRADTRSYKIIHSDGSYERQIDLPADVDIQHLFDKLRLFFDPGGTRLISRDSDGNLVAHSTTAAVDTSLGKSDPDLIFDSSKRAILSCGPAGLGRIALDDSGAKVLDTACQPDIFRLRGSHVLYQRAEGLFDVPDSGGAVTNVLPPVGQLLLVGPGGELVFSDDPPLLYGSGIGDGWLGGWRFMNRGKRPAFSLDRTRLRWYENAARSDSTGELMSATIPGGAPLLLARNARQFSEVSPGRILCVSNADGKGSYNRLILVDETARSARWVVDSAREFVRIPGTNDLLVKIVNGQIGYDIRRVPIPQP